MASMPYHVSLTPIPYSLNPIVFIPISYHILILIQSSLTHSYIFIRSKYDHHLNSGSHQRRQCMSEIMDVNESSQISDTDHYEQLEMNNVEYESHPTVR